ARAAVAGEEVIVVAVVEVEGGASAATPDGGGIEHPGAGPRADVQHPGASRGAGQAQDALTLANARRATIGQRKRAVALVADEKQAARAVPARTLAVDRYCADRTSHVADDSEATAADGTA